MQIGMPGERRYCIVQSRVPIPLLRKETQAAARLYIWDDRQMGTIGVVRAPDREFLKQCARLQSDPEESPDSRSGKANASLCPDQFPAVGSQKSCPCLGGRKSGIHRSRSDLVGGYIQ